MRAPRRVRLLDAVRRRAGGSVLTLEPAAVPAALARARRLQGGPLGRAVVGHHGAGVTVEPTTVPGDGGDPRPAWVYRPTRVSATPPPAVVNFHGGGFVEGDLAQSDWFCGEVARLAGAVVVSVDYRLAPGHPFPTPALDCYAAVAAVAAGASRWWVDPERLHVMGDSAGGNLAAVVALMARDRRRAGEPAPELAGQALIYPSVELADHLPSEHALADAPVLTLEQIRGARRLYLAGADATDPYASPLRGDPDGLPPTLIQTAENDPLRDHGTRYAAALAAAGVPVRHTCYRGAAHGYISMPRLAGPVARQAAWEVAASVTAPEPPLPG